MNNLIPVPKLAELVEHPERVSSLPVEAVPAMLGDLERLKATLWARLTLPQSNGQGAPDGDRLLDVEEAARKLSKTKDYLYRHADHYPFTVRDGRSLRFSEAGIEKFIRQKMGR